MAVFVALAQAAVATLPAAGCDAHLQTRMDLARYAQAQVEQDQAGYRLAREIVEEHDGQPRVAALWVRDGGPQRVSRGGLGVDAFYFASLDMVGKEYKLVDLTVSPVGGMPYLSALWSKGRDLQQRVDYVLSARELRKELSQGGRRTLAIAPYRMGGKTQFAALFDVASGLEPNARTGLDGRALIKADLRMRRRGYVIDRVSPEPGRPGRFTAVWRPAAGLSACERATRQFEGGLPPLDLSSPVAARSVVPSGD